MLDTCSFLGRPTLTRAFKLATNNENSIYLISLTTKIAYVINQITQRVTKQFQKLFEFENVKLKFTENAIRAIAEKAIAHKTGARGLRSVLEEHMLDIMFDLPSRDDIEEVVVNEEVIKNSEEPLLVYHKQKKAS